MRGFWPLIVIGLSLCPLPFSSIARTIEFCESSELSCSNLHFGSRIVFAEDGTFYLTVGDRYTQKQEAQIPSNHIGKIILTNAE